MTINVTRSVDAAKAMAEALTTEAPAEQREQMISEAWNATMDKIAESIRADFEDSAHAADKAVLAQRGYRQLTAAEEKFYGGFSAAMRSDNPQQAFADFVGTDGEFMPETIIVDVYKNLEQEHRLLQLIDFNYTGYMAKILRSKNRAAKAVWGAITDTITEEVKQDLEWMNIDQNKLTAFAIIPIDIVDMGYEFIDAFIRRCLSEAVFDGLEDGIVNGTGVKQPVGLIRDIHHGVSISSTTGYPAKSPVALANFGADYMAKVATMAKTETYTDSGVTYGGKPRSVPRVLFLANTATMLAKVKPALLCVGQAGYVFSEPTHATEFVECNAVADDKAVMVVEGCYMFCVGGKRNGSIEFSDEFKFLDDARTFKIIQHGDGIAEDNTAAIYLDVSDVEAVAELVKVVNTVSTKEVTA